VTVLVGDRPAPRAERPAWGTSVLTALLVTLEQPGPWAIALAGFLARGGLVVLLLPIVVLPTPARLQVELAPLLVPVVFGQPSPGLIVLAAVLAAIVVGWLLLGGLVGAWADVVLTRRVASAIEAGAAPAAARRSGDLASALAIRLLAHVPLAIALAWGAVRIVETAYRELVTPFETTTPLVIRVVSAVPETIVVVLLAWWLGETAGGLAVREHVLAGRGVGSALVRGWGALVRRPVATAATMVLTGILVTVSIAPALLAAGTAWNRLRTVLYEGRIEDVPFPLLVFVGLWLGGLVLAAVATAARSSMWTAEWLRGRAPVGTIGDEHGTDRGGWSPSDGSGRL
jgi:hypothetical protein